MGGGAVNKRGSREPGCKVTITVHVRGDGAQEERSALGCLVKGEQGGFPQGHKGEDKVEELENQYSTVSMGYLKGGRRKKQIKSRKEER